MAVFYISDWLMRGPSREWLFGYFIPHRKAGDERDQEKHQENIEQHFRDARRRGGDAGETEERGNNRYNQEYECPP
jgi:hypothetical protein